MELTERYIVSATHQNAAYDGFKDVHKSFADFSDAMDFVESWTDHDEKHFNKCSYDFEIYDSDERKIIYRSWLVTKV